MSKYNLKQVKEVGTEKEFLLQAIANELAESNRLKRLELKDKWSHFDDSEGIMIKNENELEDRA